MKPRYLMKNTYIVIALLGIASACNQGTSDVEEKRKELEEARKEQQSLKEKITKLENELKEIDPNFFKGSERAVAVSTFVPEKNPFEHKIEVRGSVSSRRNVLISAQVPGAIERVHVKEGQRVQKGQVLVSLDADIIRSNIKQLKTELELANTIYEKQSRLWDQKIGTEVQYLQAKNNKESLESRLATAHAQLDQAIIKAPFSGNVDEVPAREGEMAGPGIPLIRLTSPEDMFIQADVSERFVGMFSAGDKVDIFFPVQDRKIQSVISSVSGVINPENRTFRVEVRLPKTELLLKPNQVTVLEIRDYYKKDAVAIPTRLILKDDEGEYVYGVENGGDRKNKVAKKLRVKSGTTYRGKTEIVEGLSGNEELVDKGFRDVAEGVEVAIVASEEISEMAIK